MVEVQNDVGRSSQMWKVEVAGQFISDSGTGLLLYASGLFPSSVTWHGCSHCYSHCASAGIYNEQQLARSCFFASRGSAADMVSSALNNFICGNGHHYRGLASGNADDRRYALRRAQPLRSRGLRAIIAILHDRSRSGFAMVSSQMVISIHFAMV
ncbi:hypothetical protein BDV33DRAFT_184418 [Aspergillus novoparasiticus]|uniref:Uncharacterized protein n=1 Tax=Aspergillus novoparasiticus TaxID=986946 RepID=A0A5N6EA00_9EURO|nr:hypothetical protein BDV33DRAFT_184418 [Aspergillus novoparasiticus]